MDKSVMDKSVNMFSEKNYTMLSDEKLDKDMVVTDFLKLAEKDSHVILIGETGKKKVEDVSYGKSSRVSYGNEIVVKTDSVLEVKNAQISIQVDHNLAAEISRYLKQNGYSVCNS